MKQYRGYYIDGVIFSTKAEIDAHIKAQNIRAFKAHMRLFNRYSDQHKLERAMAASNAASRVAEFLVKQCGMTWAEIEALESAA